MRAPADLVRKAYEQAKGTDASHLLMIWAAAEAPPDDWSVQIIRTPEDLQKELACAGAFYQLREVYSMRRPLEEQLAGSDPAWFVA